MNEPRTTMAEQIAKVVSAFHKQQTGRAPRSVTVVLSEETLVITLHEALSPAEIALAQTPNGSAQLQEYHRRLFESSAQSLRQAIRRITEVAVREATVEVETMNGTVAHAFSSGTMVQVFRLEASVCAESWSGSGRDE